MNVEQYEKDKFWWKVFQYAAMGAMGVVGWYAAKKNPAVILPVLAASFMAHLGLNTYKAFREFPTPADS